MGKERNSSGQQHVPHCCLIGEMRGTVETLKSEPTNTNTTWQLFHSCAHFCALFLVEDKCLNLILTDLQRDSRTHKIPMLMTHFEVKLWLVVTLDSPQLKPCRTFPNTGN